MDQKEAYRFYLENPDIIQFILDFYQIPKGMRARIRFDWGKSGKAPSPVGYPRPTPRMQSLNKNNILMELRQGKTQHFFVYVFDEEIVQCSDSSQIEEFDEKGWKHSHIIGLTPVIELDSLKIPNGKNSERYDCLGAYSNNIISNFNTARTVIKELLKDIKNEETNETLWDSTRMMFSGNGIYFILDTFYGNNRDETFRFMLKFVELMEDINALCVERGGEPVVDHTQTLPWNDFFKCPFTFHQKYDRISIPLDKDMMINADYIRNYSDPEFLSKDKRHVEQLIKISKWWNGYE